MTDDACLLVLRAFRQGYDTAEIARLFNTTEAKVYSALHWGRLLDAIGERTQDGDQRLQAQRRKIDQSIDG